ncbi:MAG TPA: type II secretion system protein [Kiritimatiellia bacterium]|nr:type II secretion system protein [Kiritimatiellia bacterium]HPS06336.1 type II secretion system protein [Kiritimatiellia bacterium]
MNFLRDRAGRGPGGFTLVELLVVIVIIGVMALVIGPSFTAGSDAARVRTASRGVMQMSRYARNMALLHQTQVDLVFTSDGTLSVAQMAAASEGIVSAKAFGVTNSAAEAEAAELSAEPAETPEAEGGSGGGGAGYVMADLDIDKKYEQTSFVFDGYTDTLDGKHGRFSARPDDDEEASQGEGEGEEEVKTFRVRYKSNGTCRPYRVRVSASGDESFVLTVVVDVLGAAKIEEEEE